jgi:hypothetical protein
MRFKSAAVWAVLAWGCVIGTAAGQPPAKPPNEQQEVRTITIHTADSAWWLVISPDGSGVLNCGASMGLPYKKGTFDFAGTLKALRAVVQPKGTGMTDHVVELPQKIKPGPNAAAVSTYTRASGVVLPLFARAYQALPAEQRRQHFDGAFERAWNEHPPAGKIGPKGKGPEAKEQVPPR